MPRSDGSRHMRLKAIGGEPPSPDALPEGCKFHPRCAYAIARCATEEPGLTPVGDTSSACWVAQAGTLPALVATKSVCQTQPAYDPAPASAREVLLAATGLRRTFAVAGKTLFAPPRHVHAVDGVSLSIHRGETVGIVGESGCGKSTLARCLLRLIDVEAGRIDFMGQDVTSLSGDALRRIPPQYATDLPGSLRVAQSAAADH